MSMEKLEFENFDPSLPLPESKDTIYVDIAETNRAQDATKAAIDYSNKVVKILQDKMKEHNKMHPSNKVSLSQLKDVFLNGGYIFQNHDLWKEWFPEKDSGSWAMSRVHMFLRMRSGDKRTDEKHVGPNITADKFIDLSAGWCPIQEDFDSARKDLQAHDLNYTFDSMEELYLEDYKRVDLEW